VAEQTAGWIGFAVGAFVPSLIIGAALGLIPLLFGEYVDERALGRKAFLFSVLAGLVLGIIGALPVSIGFSVAISRKRRARRRNPGVQT